MEFSSKLENFNTRLWTYHVKIPQRVADHFLSGGSKRVMCSINDAPALHMAIMSAGEGVYFLNINKEFRKKHQLQEGSMVHIRLEKDTSEYGMPFPEELDEVLRQDPAGKAYFDALTPGKKRNLIYMVNKVKDTDKRIEIAIIIISHLNTNDGHIHYKVLNRELKAGL